MSLKRKRQGAASAPIDLSEATADAVPDDPDREAPPTKRVSAPRTLFVRSLPAETTNESLAEHFSQSFPLKHSTLVVDPTTKKSKGFGFVTFADAEDAQRAKEEFDGTLFAGKRIKVEVAEPRQRGPGGDEAKSVKPSSEFAKAKAERQQQLEIQPPPKLIIRNLPWSIKKPEQLSQLFLSYGKIKDVTLPKTKAGLSPGFGFVLLRGRKNAEKAMAAVNGKVVDGRTLAVDWAVKKDDWQAAQGQSQSKLEDEQGDTDSLKSESDDEGVKLDTIPPSDAEHDDASIEDDDDDDFEEDGDLEMKTEDELDDEEDEDAETGEQDSSSTLFIRNLPFTTTDDSLYEHFKTFGPVRYARVVMDYETDRSRGTGFVCFYKSEDAVECLRKTPKTTTANSVPVGKTSVKHSLLQDTQSDPTGLFTIEGRVLHVSRAVEKREAERLTTEGSSYREARDKDKRRLYLLSEGTISSNSPMYASLSPAEVKMREDSAKQRQTLIKGNPTLHLSLTRLSIRNIPRFVTSKDLKALAREAVVGFAKDVKEGRRTQLSAEETSRGGDEQKEAERLRKARGKGIVKQSKVVFEGKEGSKIDEGSGAGRSRGYGFIEYSSHRWALMGLRWLNGHKVVQRSTAKDDTGAVAQATTDRPKRLIVEFAIENAQVVARRKELELKNRERSQPTASEGGKTRDKSKYTPKPPSKNSLKNKAKLDAKRKREGGDDGVQQSDADSDDAGDEKGTINKASKRQKIIGRKRAMRKAKRTGA
jgi:nucleolar protein 4